MTNLTDNEDTLIVPGKVAQLINEHLRIVPDFPKEGISFFDMQPLFANVQVSNEINKLFKQEIEYSAKIADLKIDAIVGIDARGFVLGASLANEMRLPLILVRKAGKLPPPVFSQSYDLEYGSATLQIGQDANKAIKNVVIVDDVYATGGSMLAATKLCKMAGYNVVDTFAVLGVKELYDKYNSVNIKIISIL